MSAVTRPARRQRNPYVALVKAASESRGLWLTPSEVFDMALDQGIKTACLEGLDDATRDCVVNQVPHSYLNPTAWKGIRP